MREDFGRCVIERERRGSANSSPKARMFGRYDEDGEYEGPIKLPSGMGAHEKYVGSKIQGKEFSDVLGPVRGYLISSVGQYWPKIYSELSQGLGKFSWPLRHILEQHIHVAVDTYRGVDGKVWWNGKSGPEVVDGGYFTEFYVHPETKTLRRFERKKHRYKVVEEEVKRWDAGKGRWLVDVNGSWFLGTYALESRTYIPGTNPSNKVYDVKWPDYKPKYGIDCYRFTRIKSASKKEIKSIIGKR